MDKNPISERIRLVREAANLKQEGFAQATGVTNVTISRYEKGHRTPDADFLNHLVELYGCDPGWLLTGRGEMKVERVYSSAPREALVVATPSQGLQSSIDRETAIINKMLLEMTEAQKEDVRKYCEMSKCYAEMKPDKRA